MTNINTHHRDVYDRFLRESHNWKRRVKETASAIRRFKRIVPYEPFIYLPFEFWIYVSLYGNLNIDDCQIEYYELDNLGGSAYPKVKMNEEPNIVFGDTFYPYWEDGDLMDDVLCVLDDSDQLYKIDA